MELHDVGVLKLLQEDDFSVGPLCISRMLKGIEYFFEGQGLSSLLVGHFPDDSIGATSNFLEDVVSFEDMCFHFFRHFLLIN